ncbi:MAG: hypothetical protein ACYTEU_10825 [Planctomycetota bacterium]|jgi:hypothetical protein
MWIPKYQIMFQKVVDSWMDLMERTTDFNHPGYAQWVAAQNAVIAQQHGGPNATIMLDQYHPEILAMYNNAQANIHNHRFPIGNHLMVLMFLVASDLSEHQRKEITNNLTQKGIRMADYTWQNVTESFRDLLCSTKTGISDPNVRPMGVNTRGKGSGSRSNQRSFIIEEDGDYDDDEGWWVTDEDTGEEGFLSMSNDVFYAPLDDWGTEWETANVAGRFLKRRKNGKGRKGRRGPKGRGKFRSRKDRKGKAHVAEDGNEYNGDYSPEWNEDESYYGKGGKGKNRKGKKGNKGGGKFPYGKTSYEANGKGYTKSKSKGKSPKEGNANVAGSQSGPASDAGQPNATDGQTWNESSWNQSGDYYDEWYDGRTGKTWCTTNGDDWSLLSGSAVSFIVTELHSWKSEPKPTNEVYLAGIGRWQKIDCMKNATYVIIDSGCTRAMGSRARITAFVNECRRRGCRLRFEFKPCFTQFSFANSQSSKVYECLVIHFPTNPPCQTEIQILEEGNVPILLSLEQMRNLYMKFEHTPQVDYLTCAAFGMKNFPVPVSTTNHLIIDLADLKQSPELTQCTWLSNVVNWARSATEVNTSQANTVCQGMGITDTSTKHAAIGCEDSEESEVSHPVFNSTADDWMYPELDLPNGYGGSSSSSASPPQDDNSDGVPQRPVVTQGPPEVPISEDKSILPVRRRLRTKQQDPATEIALKRIHDKLGNENELYKLHLKHYHMKLDQFKKRTSHLKLPKEIYDLFEKVVKKCDTCSRLKDKPCRSKISGLRAEIFGDLIFVDHGEVKFNPSNDDSSAEMSYTFFIILDGATNLVSAYPVASTNEAEAREALREWMHHYQVKPKRIVADSMFMTDQWKRFYTTHDIQPISLGPYTPWPNRAEAAVRVFKKHVHQLVQDLKNDPIRKAASIRTLLREACWARKCFLHLWR